MYKLNDSEKAYIQQSKDLIEQEKWDEFFWECPYDTKVSNSRIYKFLYFEAGIDLLRKMSFIPSYAFSDCHSSRMPSKLIIPSNIDSDVSFACFKGSTIKEIEIKGQCTAIQERAFQECENLQKVVLPKTCTHLRSNSFSCCFSLSSINLDNVEKIDDEAFYGCENLTSVTVLNIKKLEPYSFWKCDNLNLVTLSKNSPVSDKDVHIALARDSDVTIKRV